jgi:two-component system response regulator CpxR
VTASDILIVDDNVDLAENVAELLELEGLNSRHFGDPRQALEWAERHPFVLALLDVRMPFMDGLSLYEKLRERHPKSRYAFVTAFDDARTRALAEQEGLDVISKPFRELEFVSKVKELAGRD